MKLCQSISSLWLAILSCQILLGIFVQAGVRYGVLDPVFFEVLQPRTLNYIFKTRPAVDFGGSFGTQPRRAYVIPAEPPVACDTLLNADEVKGLILLVERGGCSFVSKAIVAQQHDVAGLVIYDKTDENFRFFIDMVDDETGRSDQVTIPVLFLLGRDGHYLKSALQEEGLSAAEVLIPLNLTQQPDLLHHHPPWSIY